MTLKNKKTNKRAQVRRTVPANTPSPRAGIEGAQQSTRESNVCVQKKISLGADAEIKKGAEPDYVPAKIIKETKVDGELPQTKEEAEELKKSHEAEEFTLASVKKNSDEMDKIIAETNARAKSIQTIDELAELPFIEFMGAGFAAFLKDNFSGLKVDELNQERIKEVLSTKSLQKKRYQKTATK